MKILIVDDNSAICRILVNSLSHVGFEDVVQAENGREALAKLDESIDFVLTDRNMPEMSGIDLVKALRAMPGYEKFPIIMVSASINPLDLREATEAGVNGYIVKPFTPWVLKQKIEQVLTAEDEK